MVNLEVEGTSFEAGADKSRNTDVAMMIYAWSNLVNVL